MNGYLVDTNVISEYAKPLPNSRVISWLEQVDPETLFVSVITLGELRMGVENLPEGKRRSDLELWLSTGLPHWFATNLLPITEVVSDRWGRITIQARKLGLPLSTTDGLIAATAMEFDLTVVTRNTKHFVGLTLATLNPWD